MAWCSAALIILAASLHPLCGGAALGQDGPAWPPEPEDPSAGAPTQVGEVHENLRRTTRRHRLQAEGVGAYAQYSSRKLRFQQATGLQWSLDVSLLQQWGAPEGGRPSLQLLAGLSLSYDLFHHDRLGTGSLQLAGEIAAYLTDQTAADIGSSLGVISAINDWPESARQFEQLTYTQTLPGDRVSLSVGQFPFSNFDGNRYLGNQQHNFINDVFTQNGSATYAAAGLGAFGQWRPTQAIQLALGFQYPNSASVTTLSVSGLDSGESAWLGYAQWTPRLSGLGPGQYSLTYYESPSTPEQSATWGWSVNAVQDLDETWALFGRANSASGYTTPVGASYMLGCALNDPLDRSPTDQIGLAVGYSEASGPIAAPPGRRGEAILEAYWSWTLFGGLLLTPDVQLYLEPALDAEGSSAWVLSLRATLML